MKTFIEEADNGVIYFSLGTCVPDHRMPSEFYQQFIRVFKNLRQRVLWKTRRENITNIPENVYITKWVPQQDVLGKSNVQTLKFFRCNNLYMIMYYKALEQTIR